MSIHIVARRWRQRPRFGDRCRFAPKINWKLQECGKKPQPGSAAKQYQMLGITAGFGNNAIIGIVAFPAPICAANAKFS
jgi:hypothetical protein